MKDTFLLMMMLLASISVSCTKDVQNALNAGQAGEEYVVLQKRNPALPDQSLCRPIVFEEDGVSRSGSGNEILIGNSNRLLGYSYAAGNTILGDYNNVGHRIIDLEKVKEYGSDYITSKALKQFSSERFSYYDYTSYESKLSQTKKITMVFKLNLVLFSLGRKKVANNTFKSEVTSSATSVQGELNMIYSNNSFTLNAAEGARKLYARECLSPTFLRNLYSSSIGNVLNAYGEYVLTGYVTGGKAFALFAGRGAENGSSKLLEEGLNSDIDASFKWKDKSASGECKFGITDTNSTSHSYKFDELYTKLWILGGLPEGASMNRADDLKKISIDLGPWVQSLSNQDNHTIVDLTENGIYPLSAFILETNFKRRFDDTTLGLLPYYPSFVTPYIEIVRVFERYASNGDALYDIAAVLNTRQGDKIVLRSSSSELTEAELRKNESSTVFSQKANAIKQEKQKYYDLEIRANSVTRLNPIMGNPLCIDFRQMEEGAMFVYTNPRSGIQYIYDRSRKLAFSHYTDKIDGDWILDEYGIRDWVESLPEKSISMATLASYTIIGL